MTEQQAPTLQDPAAVEEKFYDHAERRGLDTTAGNSEDFEDVTTTEAWQAWLAAIELAKNIDTASPSPASLQERMRAALVELFHAEWSSGGNRYVEAQNAALRLGEELATPQPSPTGPRTEPLPKLEWPPGYCLDPNGRMIAPEGAGRHFDLGYEIGYREAFATLKGAPTGPREGEPPTLICPRCKVDRFAQACPAPGLECGLIGTTQGAPETATPSLPTEQPMKVTDEMVSRFLSWRLPHDFAPDAGITFTPQYNEHMPWGGNTHEPTGTNLLNAPQARAMLEHVLATAQQAPDGLPGQCPTCGEFRP